jgi:methylglyoxal synthase
MKGDYYIMVLALIAHDKMKDAMIYFAKKYEYILREHTILATGTTGKKIMENTGLTVRCFKSGPLGRDQEIGSRIANGKVNAVFFFRDPLTAQAHEPDISALLRLCDVYHVPLATNPATGDLLIKAIENGLKN